MRLHSKDLLHLLFALSDENKNYLHCLFGANRIEHALRNSVATTVDRIVLRISSVLWDVCACVRVPQQVFYTYMWHLDHILWRILCVVWVMNNYNGILPITHIICTDSYQIQTCIDGFCSRSMLYNEICRLKIWKLIWLTICNSLQSLYWEWTFLWCVLLAECVPQYIDFDDKTHWHKSQWRISVIDKI